MRDTLAKAAVGLGVTEFTARFLFSEWTNVIDAWQLDSANAYANVPRLGRKNRIGAKQRSRLWPVFAATRKAINDRGYRTRRGAEWGPASVFNLLPRMIEIGPNVFSQAEWAARRRRLFRAV